MDPEAAESVLAAIAMVGTVVWLIGLRFLIVSARSGSAPQLEAEDEGGLASEQPPGWRSGSVEVEGDAGTLASRAAMILAGGNPNGMGPVKIVEKTDRVVRFERVEMGPGNRGTGHWFRRAELRFTPLGSGQTRVGWAYEPASMRWLLWLGAGFQAAGLIALVVTGGLLYRFVATSPDETVRWQTFQMIQVIHFLWPPFLFGGLYRYGMKTAAAQFEALAHNLPYCVPGV